MNSNGDPEMAVLRMAVDGRVNVQIRDTGNGAALEHIGVARNFAPLGMTTLPDLDGNGTDELVLFGRRFLYDNPRAVIRDSASRRQLGVIWFDGDYPGRDVVRCSDVNGNGAEDVALLGRNTTGELRAFVHDGRHTGPIGVVNF